MTMIAKVVASLGGFGMIFCALWIVFASIFSTLSVFDSRRESLKFTFQACVGDFNGFEHLAHEPDFRYVFFWLLVRIQRASSSAVAC